MGRLARFNSWVLHHQLCLLVLALRLCPYSLVNESIVVAVVGARGPGVMAMLSRDRLGMTGALVVARWASAQDPVPDFPVWPVWEDLLRQVFLGNNLLPAQGPPPPLFYTFAGMLITFLVTRGITRFIRRRSASGAVASGPVKDIMIGGVHIHHQVFGITTITAAGLLLVAISPTGIGLAVLATLLGVGAGLAFDEFALWLHLDDVYWRAQGRKSVDAVAVVLVLTGVLTAITGQVQDAASLREIAELIGPMVWWLAAALIGLTLVPAAACLLKGKPITAGVGVAYLPVGFIGAVRLGKPDSWWARHFYSDGSGRARRSAARFGELHRERWNRVRDIVAGAPEK